MKNKLISTFLTALTLTSVPVIVPNSNAQSLSSETYTNQEANDETLSNKIKKTIKNNKYKIIAGGTALVSVLGIAAYYYKNTSLSLKIKGIQNLGASCYLNTAIQQLYRCENFRNIILSENLNSSDHPTAYIIKKIFLDLQSSNDISEENIKNYATSLGYHGIQEASDEFFIQTIAKCEEELNKNLVSLSSYIQVSEFPENHSLIKAMKSSGKINSKN